MEVEIWRNLFVRRFLLSKSYYSIRENKRKLGNIYEIDELQKYPGFYEKGNKGYKETGRKMLGKQMSSF